MKYNEPVCYFYFKKSNMQGLLFLTKLESASQIWVTHNELVRERKLSDELSLQKQILRASPNTIWSLD